MEKQLVMDCENFRSPSSDFSAESSQAGRKGRDIGTGAAGGHPVAGGGTRSEMFIRGEREMKFPRQTKIKGLNH